MQCEGCWIGSHYQYDDNFKGKTRLAKTQVATNILIAGHQQQESIWKLLLIYQWKLSQRVEQCAVFDLHNFYKYGWLN